VAWQLHVIRLVGLVRVGFVVNSSARRVASRSERPFCWGARRLELVAEMWILLALVGILVALFVVDFDALGARKSEINVPCCLGCFCCPPVVAAVGV